MANVTFSDEYKTLVATLKAGSFNTAKGDAALVSKISSLCVGKGPDKAHASATKSLQTLCKLAKDAKEGPVLERMAGSGTGLAKRAAALKVVRHLDLLRTTGSHSLWLAFPPKDYTKWPSDLLSPLTGAALTEKLGKTAEFWDADDVKNISNATQNAVAWAQKAAEVCGQDKGKVGADALVKRWFADEDHQDKAKIGEIKKTLVEGYKKISVMALSQNLILSKVPGYPRKTTTAMVAKAEKLNVIYIESAFFNTKQTLTGSVNWGRIIVHELSHRAVKTDDVVTHGKKRYSHHPRGLKPMKDSFTTAQALKNADNWAFFAVDAAGQLGEAGRKKALERVGL